MRVAHPKGAAVRQEAALDSPMVGRLLPNCLVRVARETTLPGGKKRAEVETAKGQRGWSTMSETFFATATSDDVARALARFGGLPPARGRGEVERRARGGSAGFGGDVGARW